jgi:hypothetical protein
MTKTPIEKLQDLLPGVVFILTEAARREDILIFSVSMDYSEGIDVFTGKAGAREHLANVLGMPSQVKIAKHGGYYRQGQYAGVWISIWGGSPEDEPGLRVVGSE